MGRARYRARNRFASPVERTFLIFVGGEKVSRAPEEANQTNLRQGGAV
jgi:hypothetical protein